MEIFNRPRKLTPLQHYIARWHELHNLSLRLPFLTQEEMKRRSRLINQLVEFDRAARAAREAADNSDD